MPLYDSKLSKFRFVSLRENVNFLFFIGRGKAHTFRIPFGFIVAGAATLLGLVVWSLVSIVIVFFIDHQNNWLEGQLDATRGVVLKYQAKYEGLYENSYPASVRKKKAEAAPKPLEVIEAAIPEKPQEMGTEAPLSAGVGDQTDKKKPKQRQDNHKEKNTATAPKALANADLQETTNDQTKPAPSPKGEEKIKTAVGENLGPPEPRTVAEEKTVPANAAEAKEAASDEPSDLISLEKFKLTHKGAMLTIEFGVRNLGKVAKVRGYIYAIAEWQPETETESLYVGLPPQIQLNTQLGIPANPLGGITFSARRYRPTRFRFKNPPSEAGQYIGIRVVILDQKGNMLLQRIENLSGSKVAKKTENQ